MAEKKMSDEKLEEVLNEIESENTDQETKEEKKKSKKSGDSALKKELEETQKALEEAQKALEDSNSKYLTIISEKEVPPKRNAHIPMQRLMRLVRYFPLSTILKERQHTAAEMPRMLQRDLK